MVMKRFCYSCGLFAIVATLGCGDAKGVTFAEIRVDDITVDSATIHFTTSIPSAGTVDYGTSETELNLVASDDFATTHDIPLQNLSSATTYYFRIRAERQERRTVYLADPSSFATLP